MSVRSRVTALERQVRYNERDIKSMQDKLDPLYYGSNKPPTMSLPVVDNEGKPVKTTMFGNPVGKRQDVPLADVVRLLADKLKVDLVYRNDEPGRVELTTKQPREKK